MAYFDRITLLDKQNYATWKIQALRILEIEGLLDWISVDTQPEINEIPTDQDFIKIQFRSRTAGILKSMCIPELEDEVDDENDPAKIWAHFSNYNPSPETKIHISTKNSENSEIEVFEINFDPNLNQRNELSPKDNMIEDKNDKDVTKNQTKIMIELKQEKGNLLSLKDNVFGGPKENMNLNLTINEICENLVIEESHQMTNQTITNKCEINELFSQENLEVKGGVNLDMEQITEKGPVNDKFQIETMIPDKKWEAEKSSKDENSTKNTIKLKSTRENLHNTTYQKKCKSSGSVSYLSHTYFSHQLGLTILLQAKPNPKEEQLPTKSYVEFQLQLSCLNPVLIQKINKSNSVWPGGGAEIPSKVNGCLVKRPRMLLTTFCASIDFHTKIATSTKCQFSKLVCFQMSDIINPTKHGALKFIQCGMSEKKSEIVLQLLTSIIIFSILKVSTFDSEKHDTIMSCGVSSKSNEKLLKVFYLLCLQNLDCVFKNDVISNCDYTYL